MTKQEAITYWEKFKSEIPKLISELERYPTDESEEIEGLKEQFAYVGVAIEALEKQIPKKPIEEQGLMTCPICGCQDIQYVDWFGTREMNYCPCCSQAIDWSDRDE